MNIYSAYRRQMNVSTIDIEEIVGASKTTPVCLLEMTGRDNHPPTSQPEAFVLSRNYEAGGLSKHRDIPRYGDNDKRFACFKWIGMDALVWSIPVTIIMPLRLLHPQARYLSIVWHTVC